MFRRAIFLGFIIVTTILALALNAFAQWNEEVLYSFQGGTDGARPIGGTVFDKAGNLYGAANEGGSSSCAGPSQCGTVFELSPPAKNGDPWVETVLYVFRGRSFGDGASPGGGVVMDALGNLYGVTGYDGTGDCTLLGTVVGCGTVYELSPPSQPGGAWTETVLYSFQGGSDGYVPTGDLVFDEAGNLYGATLFGGGKGGNCDVLYGGNCGMIFELSPPEVKGGVWTEKVLHSFAGVASGGVILGDGAEPNGGLVFDADGNIYGTTNVGGFNCAHSSFLGCGTVFELTHPNKGDAAGETILHAFLEDDPSDGAGPSAGAVLDKEGNLFGTTTGGGTGLEGTVFELKRPTGSGLSWAENILYSFTVTNGALPSGPVLIDPSDDSVYVTAAGGGTSRGGTLSKLEDQSGKGWVDTVLYNFIGGGTDAAHPDSKLVFRDGALYSNSLWGGTGSCQGGCGTVYKVWP